MFNLLTDDVIGKLLVGKKTIDIEEEINDGKIIIADLAKGDMGNDSAPAVGKLLISLIQSGAEQRIKINKDYRKDTFVVVDEFPNYVNTSMKSIMAEERKYKVSFLLSQQVAKQGMTKSLSDLISGNTGLKIGGESDHPTRLELSKDLKGIKTKDFDRLPKYSFFVYDTNKSNTGTKILNVPDYLVKIKAPFYMDKKALRDYFKWLVYESGYYIKDTGLDDLLTKQRGFSGDTKGNKNLYDPKFTD